MSYTPTTENIFDVALHGARAVSVEMSSVLNESEFRAQLDRWLAALIREAKAEAWYECDERITNHIHDTTGAMSAHTVVTWPKNPYREGSET